MLGIECTVGSPDARGKLGKLVARLERIRTQLPGIEVIALLTTALPRAALSKAEVEKAERDHVVLLAKEDLQELWTAAQGGATSAQTVQRFRRRLLQARLLQSKRPVVE